ncbi:hypothetical protein Uis1B_0106 [Bifidobacterium margollesii]|uniref:Uncharacterized protein n=1 Tax=Bifidobacterium margollesii TaxID=2020964 RepID=A0A2N5JCS3_9BIFI|nr:hypothetical protein [Bifidobacterium margollesii]PLS32014.1 hypothetical protein Uis1B_0106 [Bifidobacterium margollesii]
MAQIILYNEKNDKMVFIQAEIADGKVAFTGLDQAGELDFVTPADQLEATLAPLTSADTFTLNESLDGKFKSMTYGEWEALRCAQASAGIKAKVDALAVSDDVKAEIKGFFDSFTKSMTVKYIQGKRSWGQIYGELFDDFSKLAK